MWVGCFVSGYGDDHAHERIDTTASQFPAQNSSFPSGDPHHPYQSSNTWAQQATPHPRRHDTPRRTSHRRQNTSATPAATYAQPSWVTASQFQQPSSPHDPWALTRRPGSSMMVSSPRTPFTNSPPSTLGRSPSVSAHIGLPDRPSKWRRDFSARSGLASILPRPRRQLSVSHGGTVLCS